MSIAKGDLKLIADQEILHYLNTFKEDDDESFKETKCLLQRKISGDNPSEEEWIKNANANEKSIAKAIAKANAKAKAYAKANAYAKAYHEGHGENGNAKNNYVADYIINLINGYIGHIENDELDNKIVKVWHKGTTTYSRGELEIALSWEIEESKNENN